MSSTSFILWGTSALAAAAVGCAASQSDDAVRPASDAGGTPSALPEAGAPDLDPGEGSVDQAQCSQDGWCATALPASDLTIKDVWPVGTHAFAVAESPTLGVKVLEWDDATRLWTFIDDGSQNESGRGTWVGKIWAPSEDEIYYGVSPGIVYHGRRLDATWSWTWHALTSNTSTDPQDGNPSHWNRGFGVRTPALGVWGTSSTDVYAWFKDTIYHRSDVGEWIAEYVADDVDAPDALYFFAAAGIGADDVWFAGTRMRGRGCALLVHKTVQGYQRVGDAIVPASGRCVERPETVLIGESEGWLTDIQMRAPDELIGLKGARDVVRISINGDRYQVSIAPIPEVLTDMPLHSLSTTSSDVMWLGGGGLVVRGSRVWEGGGYEISRTTLIGGPLEGPIYQVRGASNDNIWAVGVRNALHKTTP
jgi:hypothetical protein